jgi:hypothetical protein
MSNPPQAPAAKKETLYEGPPPAAAWRVPEAPLAKKETVYGGPAAPAKETLFDESRFVAKTSDNSLAVRATTGQIRRASLRFFIVAGITLLEGIYLGQAGDKVGALAAGVVVAVFALLGIFAYRKSKAAFLVGMGLYALDTLLLILVGMNSTVILVAYAVVVHCIVIYRLYVAYGMIRELEMAEA